MQSGNYAPPPKRSDGMYRDEAGNAFARFFLGGASRGGFDMGGQFYAYIAPNTDQVYISEMGGFAGELTTGPWNLETIGFPRHDYTEEEILAMQQSFSAGSP